MAIVRNIIYGGNGGNEIVVEANYSALPDPTTVSGQFYWCSSSQGTSWLPGSLGGTYYNSGLYYSNGTNWEFLNVPYNATQSEVNSGTNNDKFVTPNTLSNSNWAFTSAKVIATLLTGFTSGSGVVSATDTILQAFQKIVGNIDLKVDKADFVDYSSTSTIVGWSAFVTKVIRYQLSYKRYMLFIDVDGTSNSATTTITLPIAPRVSGVYFTYSKNSGVVSTGTLELTSGSTTAVFKSSVSGSNYSSSGGKRVHISLTIETA